MALALDELVGTWTLRRIDVRYEDRTVRSHAEPTVSGMLVYTPDAGVWVILHVPADHPDGLIAGAYTGTVDVVPDGVVHHVTVGTVPFVAGAALSRSASLSEQPARLTLSGRLNDDATASLVWEPLQRTQ